MGIVEASGSVDMGPALDLVRKMSPVSSTDIIPLLQRLQDAYGYLPREVVLAVCEQTGLPASRVFGVATFYGQFHLEPHGRHTVRVCRGTACHVRGGKKVLDAVKRTLSIDDGETSEDMEFSLETVACLGACALSPVMVVDGTYYGKTTPRRAQDVLRALKQEVE
jgi:NADH:ubiquinone oxidoreductase subunit E